MQLSSDDDGDDGKDRVLPKVTPAILAKRRGSVPHVVRVQNLPYSPDRIRNKGSPVKTPPSESASTEASGATTSMTAATKGRKKVVLKGRRKLAGLSEAGSAETMTTSTAAPRGPSKSKKRKLDHEAATESVQEVSGDDEPVMKKKTKKPLSVKFDTDDDRPRKAGKAKAGPRLANSPQRLSSIPVEVCIETLGSSSSLSPAPHKRGRKPKKIAQKKTLLLLPEIAKAEKPIKGRPKKVFEDVEPEPAPKSVRSTRSNEGRTTRSKDWSWEKVLLINPDKITKKKT